MAWTSLAFSAFDDSTPDTILARAIREGNRAAFALVFDRYAPRLVAFARLHLGSLEDAEDLVQDIFLALWASRESWVLRGPLNSYLYQAIRHRIANVYRNRRTHPIVLYGDQGHSTATVADSASADEGALTADLETALGRAVAALPLRCQQVFLLHRAQHLSYREIGEMFGISPKTVDRHMARAMAALRDALRDWNP